MARYAYDVIIVCIGVHGGSFHKIFRLQEMMQAIGLRSRVLLNCDPPLGLQMDIDIHQEHIEQLAARDVYILTRRQIRETVRATPARLFLFDGYEDTLISELVSLVRSRHNAKTGQLPILLEDFCYWGTDYVFLQHPITLWYVLARHRRTDALRLVEAQKIFFAGNILYEPVCNTWTSDVTNREEFFLKYGFDLSLPLCLWLPDRVDDYQTIYGKVVKAVRSVPMNLAVKLHPWEYKSIRHGFDRRYGEGTTSAHRWGLKPIEERDSSWAMKFCDVAVLGVSSTGIEMPWWGKPVIYVSPPNRLTEVVKSCSVRLDDAAQLQLTLSRDFPFSFSDQNYAAARALISLESCLDSFQLHLKYILEILDMPSPGRLIGSMKHIRRLYQNRVPEFFLREARKPNIITWLVFKFPQLHNSTAWKTLRSVYRLFR